MRCTLANCPALFFPLFFSRKITISLLGLHLYYIESVREKYAGLLHQSASRENFPLVVPRNLNISVLPSFAAIWSEVHPLRLRQFGFSIWGARNLTFSEHGSSDRVGRNKHGNISIIKSSRSLYGLVMLFWVLSQIMIDISIYLWFWWFEILILYWY